MRFTLPGVPSITSRCGPSSAADRDAVLTESPVETSSTNEDEPTKVVVRWRPDDGDEVAGSFDEFDANLLKSSVPWRVFRWRKGQRHYSGSYWSSTMDTHVIYESQVSRLRGGSWLAQGVVIV
jgi:Tol biopolymer transport system component